MIIKTQGIVLRQLKFSDTKRIVHIFTKSSGKKSFVVYNSSKKKNKMNFFQPLFVLNLEYNDKNNNKLLNFKEASILKPYQTLLSSPEKISIVFFIAEVLGKIIQDDFIDKRFFDFLVRSFYSFDKHEKPANFHLAFMAAMSIYVGIMPDYNFSTDKKFFSLKEGHFSEFYSKDYSMDEYTSLKFKQILDAGIQDFSVVKLNQRERQILLQKILNFYSYHFPSISNLKSIEVLGEIFE